MFSWLTVLNCTFHVYPQGELQMEIAANYCVIVELVFPYHAKNMGFINLEQSVSSEGGYSRHLLNWQCLLFVDNMFTILQLRNNSSLSFEVGTSYYFYIPVF